MENIYCSYNKFNKSVFGALRQDEACIFRLCVPCSISCEAPRMVLIKDGQAPSLIVMEKTEVKDGRDVFSVSVSLKETGLYYYYFDLYKDYIKLFYSYGGKNCCTSGEGEKWQLTVYEKDFTAPGWLYGGVMYQIFPDRFYEGVKQRPLPFDGRVYRADKENEPYFWPNEQHEGYLNMDYYGGDFAGIEEKLPYLQGLGVTCIYLNPIFEAHSNHRYNTADYMKPDPALGTAEDFARLCTAAKKCGIGIILDGVFSHTGSDSIYFNREGRYESLGAYQSESSPYRGWYEFSDKYPLGYRSWWGFESLPEVNEDNADYRNFICGEGGVIDYWLSLGASGFRLDVADELPDNFIELIRTAVKRSGKDKVLIGEVWEDATNKESYGCRRTYLYGKGLDTIMNYPFRTAVLEYMQNGNACTAFERIMQICEHYPAPALNCLMNFLSTHDTERGITAIAGDSINGRDRYWQSGRVLSAERYELGRRLCRLAYAMLFTLPGLPSVYYGDEIFMQGYKDPFNRGYFNWNSTDELLRSSIKELSQVRKSCDAFECGGLSLQEISGGFLHYERTGKKHKADIIINRTNKTEHRAVLGSIREIGAYDYLVLTSGIT